MRASVVITTSYNHLEDCLKPCIKSLEKTLTQDKCEIIVVANGSHDGTQEYVKGLGYKLVDFSDPIGYPKAANEGIKVASTDYVILLNDDVVMIDNEWVEKLLSPFVDEKIGIVGLHKKWHQMACGYYVTFFCVAIRKTLFDEIGLLDEIFSPGTCEDVDFCIRATKAGYKLAEVDFLLEHKYQTTWYGVPGIGEACRRNDQIVYERHNPKYKLNNGAERIAIGREEPFLPGVHVHEKARYEWVAKNLKGKKILEIGCGSGYGTRFLPPDVNYSGMDYNRDIIDFATKEFGDSTHRFMCINVIDWDSAWFPEKFDTIIVLECIEHLPNGKMLAQKLKESTDCLLISVPNNEPPGGWGPFHVLHNLSAKDFPGFRDEYMDLGCNMVDKFDGAGWIFLKWEDKSKAKQELKEQDGWLYDEIFDVNVYGIKEGELEDRTIIDIGANLGYFTAFAAMQYAKRVVAIEAQPDIFGGLVANVERYCQDIKVDVCNAVVLDKSNEMVSINNAGGASSIYSNQPGKLVGTITIEDLLKKFSITDDNMVLKMDIEGAEYDVLLSMPDQLFDRFSMILIEVHPETHPIHKGLELVNNKLFERGFICGHVKEMSTKDSNGNWIQTPQKTIKYIRPDLLNKKYRVLCSISTKDRYFTTLPLAISSVANQTLSPDELIIYDDGEQKDLRENEVYKHLFKTLDGKGIKWQVKFGPRLGQHWNHEKANMSGYDLVWRMDDDTVAEPDVLERLLKYFDDPFVGAVAGAVITPGEEQTGGFNKMVDILDTPNVQWARRQGIGEVDHLYSSFLYRAGIVHYAVELSPVAHREETIFSHELKRAGYKLIVDTNIVTWHYRSSSGGIRSHQNEGFYYSDEKVFAKRLASWGYKLIDLNSGIGDHFAFLNILPKLKEKYGSDKLIIGCCYPQVFKNVGVKLTSIAAIEKLATENIYEFMDLNHWTGQLKDAYAKLYEVDNA